MGAKILYAALAAAVACAASAAEPVGKVRPRPAGEVFALPAGQVREEGGFTVYSGVPVHDYPWLLAERRAIPLCRQ